MSCPSKSVSFDPATDIPSLRGKVILITGGNAGLGKQCVLEYARHDPAQIWIAARSLEKAKAAADDVRKEVPNAPIQYLQLDLNSLASVKKAAETFLSQAERLDILMLNAGIMSTPPALTADGYESQFGTNFLSHALFTKMLLPLLQKTKETHADADVRVVCLSSIAHIMPPKGGIQFDRLKTTCDDLGGGGRYASSKLATIIYARKLAALYPQFTVTSIHPGLVHTNLTYGAKDSSWIMKQLTPVMRLFFVPIEKGTHNQLWASVSNDVKSGEYYQPVGIGGKEHALGRDAALAEKLWTWTENELDGFLAASK